MNKKINKTILLFLLFTVIFINSRHVYCATIKETTSNSIITSGSVLFTGKEGLVYKVIDNASGINECRVVSYTGNSRKVIIPDEYNGYAVTSVADNAFYGNEIIESITLNSNITSIGNSAFAYCSSLENIDFTGSSIQIVPAKCFEACGALKTAILPSSVQKINKRAFAFCDSLYQAVIPGQAEFGKDVFYGCNKNRLTIITPKKSMTEEYALENNILVTDTDNLCLSSRNCTGIEGSQYRIYAYNAPYKVKWKSFNKKVAKVNQNGKIIFLKKGTAIITAETAGNVLKCKVKVLKRNKKNCLKVIYTTYIKKEMTDYEKIYATHAWLVQNVKYDKTLYKKGTVPAISHTAEGAFNRGIAVCDGYSKAFIIIMEHYGIKCKMVTGGRHAWNMVKIKNKWYHIDCTYDDPIVNGRFNNKTVFFDFFLKTDKEMYATHTWDYGAFPKCSSKKINKNYTTVLK